MALVGGEGKLKLKREPADAVTTSPAAQIGDKLLMGPSSIWSGDRVRLSAPRGVPFIGEGGEGGPYLDQPLAPGGMGVWPGSPWQRHPAWNGVIGPWESTSTSPWPVLPVLLETEVFASFDQMGQISFYATREGAINGEAFDRLPLAVVDFGTLTITPLEGEWLCQGDLKSWKLNLDATQEDTTALGQRFGESIKLLITGGGELDFMVDRKRSDGIADAMVPLRLLLMLDKGCKASAEFWMIEDRKPDLCSGLQPGDLYYSGELMVVGTGAGAKVDEGVMMGSAAFVTVGETRLKVGIAPPPDA